MRSVIRKVHIPLLLGLALTATLTGCGSKSGSSLSVVQQATDNTNNATKLDDFVSGAISAHITVAPNAKLSSQDQQSIDSINSTRITINEDVKRYNDVTATRYLILGSSEYDVGIKHTNTPVSYYTHTVDGKTFTVNQDVNNQWQVAKLVDGQLPIPVSDGVDIFQLMKYAQGAKFQNQNGQYEAQVSIDKPSQIIPLFQELIPTSSMPNADLQNGNYTVTVGITQGAFGWEFTLLQIDAVLPVSQSLEQQGVTGDWYIHLSDEPAVDTSMSFVIPAGVPSP